MVVINKLVCENLGKGLEFSKTLLWRGQWRELGGVRVCLRPARHGGYS